MSQAATPQRLASIERTPEVCWFVSVKLALHGFATLNWLSHETVFLPVQAKSFGGLNSRGLGQFKEDQAGPT